MVDRNNAGRLGAGFISVYLETRWLSHFGGFYVPEPLCTHQDSAKKVPARGAFSCISFLCVTFFAQKYLAFGAFFFTLKSCPWGIRFHCFV